MSPWIEVRQGWWESKNILFVHVVGKTGQGQYTDDQTFQQKLDQAGLSRNIRASCRNQSRLGLAVPLIYVVLVIFLQDNFWSLFNPLFGSNRSFHYSKILEEENLLGFTLYNLLDEEHSRGGHFQQEMGWMRKSRRAGITTHMETNIAMSLMDSLIWES